MPHTHGDVRAVQRFSRHAKVDTVLVYDDARRDLGGDVAKLVASS
jgi:integrase/recombinase XerC